MSYDASEQDVVMDEFVKMLRAATGDGGKKRAAGIKPPWWKDGSHWPALYRHIRSWQNGEMVDKDSGAHPLVHAAWRALAIAHIENGGGLESIQKECASCLHNKPLTDFPRGPITAWFGRGSYCKNCHAGNERSRRWGISKTDLDLLLEKQGNRCAICQRQRKPEAKEFAVDHDHDTGEVRGVLCGECNAGLGMFHDNPDSLLAAIQYLAKTKDVGEAVPVVGGLDPGMKN